MLSYKEHKRNSVKNSSKDETQLKLGASPCWLSTIISNDVSANVRSPSSGRVQRCSCPRVHCRCSPAALPTHRHTPFPHPSAGGTTGGRGEGIQKCGKVEMEKKKDNTREDEGLVAICRVDVGKVKYLCGRTSTSEPLSWNNDDKTTSIMLRHIKFAWRQNLVNVNILRIQTVLRAAESTADPAWSWKCYLRSY